LKKKKKHTKNITSERPLRFSYKQPSNSSSTKRKKTRNYAAMRYSRENSIRQKNKGVMITIIHDARRDVVDRVLQMKLFNFLRFSLPSSLNADWQHCKRVLAWPFWPTDADKAIQLAASCLMEVVPWTLAFRVLHALVCALVVKSDGKHELLAAQIRSGDLRACVAMRELFGGCDAVATSVAGGTFVISSPPKLFVCREGCDVVILSARLEGKVCFFAVPLREAGQLVPGVRFGSLGEGETSGWVRLYDVAVGKEALLPSVSLNVVDELFFRCSTAALGHVARNCTRFAIDNLEGRLIETSAAQHALVVAHADLFALDLLRKGLSSLECSGAGFAARLSAASIDALIEVSGVSGVAEVNTLTELADHNRVLQSLSGDDELSLARRLMQRFEERYGGVAGALRWLRKRLTLFGTTLNPLLSCDPTWLRSSDFQRNTLLARLFVLTGQLLEKPKTDWSKANDLVRDVADTWLAAVTVKIMTHLEESIDDDRTAAVVARCRTLFVLSNWDEIFLVCKGVACFVFFSLG
jgi:alkylation response protein AidB-like acyl-CoA dehydrogenase